jgi:hypothetical protein
MDVKSKLVFRDFCRLDLNKCMLLLSNYSTELAEIQNKSSLEISYEWLEAIGTLYFKGSSVYSSREERMWKGRRTHSTWDELTGGTIKQENTIKVLSKHRKMSSGSMVLTGVMCIHHVHSVSVHVEAETQKCGDRKG